MEFKAFTFYGLLFFTTLQEKVMKIFHYPDGKETEVFEGTVDELLDKSPEEFKKICPNDEDFEEDWEDFDEGEWDDDEDWDDEDEWDDDYEDYDDSYYDDDNFNDEDYDKEDYGTSYYSKIWEDDTIK